MSVRGTFKNASGEVAEIEEEEEEGGPVVAVGGCTVTIIATAVVIHFRASDYGRSDCGKRGERDCKREKHGEPKEPRLFFNRRLIGGAFGTFRSKKTTS